MKSRLFLILTSIIIGCILMSGGYGLWEKKLTIRGSLKVVAPPPPFIPLQAPALSPTLAPVVEPDTVPAPTTGPESSPIPDAIQENNQTEFTGNDETAETPSAPDPGGIVDMPENTAEVLQQSDDTCSDESTGAVQ